ncbi:MAG: L-threonine aldolase [Acidobacteria bacterium]|nr:L-threonine aldolase [Acidobacteriota bacterium]
MAHSVIDLRSDTLSMPTEEMLRSIQTAELGDDSRDGDPTVLELESLAAGMLGKEAALLTVSGTMSNLVAMRTHADPGGAAAVEQSAHLYGMEFGGIAAACGLLVLPVPGSMGAMLPEQLEVAVRRGGAGFPARGLVCLEDTHNAAGGTVIPPEHLDRCCEIAHSFGLPVHLDGARLFNAAVALKIEARELTRSVDSVSVCLSKGLSAPVGSLLAGSAPFVERARKVRRAFGGTMRQAGIIAAPGLLALRTMVGRLAEDHANARLLGLGLAGIEGLDVNLATVQTNIVNLDVRRLGIDAAVFARHLDPRRVRGLPGMGTVVRFVTYRGISRDDVVRATETIREVVGERPWAGR